MSDQTETAEAGLPATLETAARASVPAPPRDGLTLLDPASFERALKLAELMAEAKGLPGFYSRSPGTCLAAIEDGLRIGVSPFVVARNSYQAHPSAPLAYYGKFVAAIINAHPAINGDLEYEHFGPWEKVRGKFEIKESPRAKDQNGNASKYASRAWSDADEEEIGVRVRGVMKETGQVKEIEIYMRSCWPRNSTLWASQPDQQICYVAARRWADRYAPHILMGINLAEEMPDLIEVNPEDRPAGTTRPSGSRLQRFVELNAPGSARAEPAAQASSQPAQDAAGTRPAQGQGDLGLAGDRALAGAAAAGTGQPHTTQQAGQGEPQRPTMVDTFLPGATAGETLAISAASALILREAAGKDRGWLNEAQKINPWIARHKITREAIAGLVHDLEEGKQP